MKTKAILINESDWTAPILKKVDSLKANLPGNQACLVVGIAGGSCTGKSSQVAKVLLCHFSTQAQLLAQDNYQKGIQLSNYFEFKYHWDDPANFGIEESRQMLETLKKGGEIDMPVYSFEKKRQIGYEKICSTPIVFFEGLYACDSHIKPVLDLSIYVESPLYGRLLRRVFR
ncbi:MAG: uridine kinase, partial [Cyclobacteriaceae bacterium]